MGTKFISFKVPLKDALCRRLEENKRFTPGKLMKLCPKLGLVIDLTCTTRYYDCKVFKSYGVQYKKISCPGRVIPADNLLEVFFNTVDAFLAETNGRDLLVGVHCTHGLNRTGYFTCRYMNLRMGIEPQEAISAFEKARGHNIERLPYIQRILSGRSLEDENKKQHGRTKPGGHHSGSGPIDTDTHLNPGREHYREHYPSPSQPPPLLHSHPDSLVTESQLANLYSGYISSSSYIHRGPSKNDGTGNRNSGPQGHIPHHSYSRSKKHRKNKKHKKLGKQLPVEHPDRSKSQSGISREVGLFGSNPANYSLNEFSVPAGTFFRNPLLNPRNEHFHEHLTASSQPLPFLQRHPDSTLPDSPLTSLFSDYIASSTSLRRVPPKNGGTGNLNAGYQGYSLDDRYSPYGRHHGKKHQTLGQEPPVRHTDGCRSQPRTSGDVSLFGSNSPNNSISEFSVPAGTFIPNALLNLRSEHSREHHPASS